MKTTEDLAQNDFSAKAMHTATQVMMSLDKAPLGIDPEFIREPDEHEFYVLGVGQAIADVLGCSQQLEHAVALLGDFSYSPKLREGNVQRNDHLEYNIENYVIRTQILYERVLQLVNRVFHLQYPTDGCTHAALIRNLKVARTRIPAAIGPLRKKIREYAEHRNVIVHRESYKANDLRRLRLLYLATSETEHAVSGAQAWRKRLLRDVLAKKRAEFGTHNDAVIRFMLPLFDALGEVYDDERRRLARIVGPLKQDSSS